MQGTRRDVRVLRVRLPRSRDRGATGLEYGLMIAGGALVALIGVTTLGEQVGEVFRCMGEQLESSGTAACGDGASGSGPGGGGPTSTTSSAATDPSPDPSTGGGTTTSSGSPSPTGSASASVSPSPTTSTTPAP